MFFYVLIRVCINELSDATQPTLYIPFLASLMITIQYARSIYNKNELMHEWSSTIILIARSFVAVPFVSDAIIRDV